MQLLAKLSGYLVVLVLFFISLNSPFFWDTVQLGSKHATYFYNNELSTLLLPNELDSGHIPAFGFYIAFMWELFGRSLWVSHLAMLPFALGIVYQLQKLTKKYVDPKFVGLASLLLLLDPTLLAQISLVSPDVPLVFFFLWGLNAVLTNKRLWILIAVFCLFLVSMRGMMVAFCLLVFDLYRNTSNKTSAMEVGKDWLRKSLAYLPALILFVAFSIIHYKQKGWIGFHEDSPWTQSFEWAGLKGMLYNIGILGWRILDFGRIGLWLLFGFLLLKLGRRHFKEAKLKRLFAFFVIIALLLPLTIIWAKGLIGHRYLIPIYLVFALVCLTMLFSNKVPTKIRNVLIVIWIVFLGTGHLWIYPVDIAQGWDASLAHRPYFELREQAVRYLNDEKIAPETVGSFFPNANTFDAIDLNDQQTGFVNFSGQEPYAFYSNVFNASDEHLKLLSTAYSEVKKLERFGVFVTIYKRQ